MAIFQLFSKRKKAQNGEVPDVYRYDLLPNKLVVQIVHIWMDVIGNSENYHDHYGHGPYVQQAYGGIIDVLCREYGLFALPTANKHTKRMYLEELCNFFLQSTDVDEQLDIIELSFKFINTGTRNYDYLGRSDSSELADAAIDELNKRFNEHGIGYQFNSGEIVRVDSEFIHVEAVKPALRLLSGKSYSGAQQEFLSAYEHYRHERHKEALNDCLKAFESTLKVICDKRGWKRNANATASTLIQICFDNGLIPSFWQQEFGSLRSLLESGIPTGRNKLSGHGQGTKPTSVPSYYVSYMLHMTASTLVFLVNADSHLS